MRLHPLVGHESIRRTLAGALGRGTLPSALLLHGPRGVGKQRLALWLAQLVVCESPAEEPCGRCRPCRMASSLEHPDVHWYFPLERPKGASGDRLADALEDARMQALAELREDPMWQSHHSDLRALHLGTVQNLRRRAYKRPTLSAGPVFVIGNAELLVPQESSQEAANALLKLLEEPPGDTRLFLTSSEPGLLLPTIRSRTVPLQVGPLPESTVEEFLRTRTRAGADPRVAARAARLAGGSIGRGLGLLPLEDGGAGPLEGFRQQALRIVTAALTGDRGAAHVAALEVGPARARGLLDLFSFVEEWIRDLGAVSVGADDAVLHADAAGHLRKQAAAHRVEGVDVPAAFARIETARELARGNVNPQLVVSRLVRDLREALVDRQGAGAAR